MIKLNKRLTTISAFIDDNDKVLDIGCDHDLLAIYNYLTRGMLITGSDNKKEPLKKALDNLKKYGLEKILSLKEGDGLSPLDSSFNTIVISGMGSTTITRILKDIDNYPNINKIILSPNNDFPFLRLTLNHMGLMIKEEVMVEENNKYYLVLVYQKGQEIIDPFFGKLAFNDQNTINYYKNLYDKNQFIIQRTTNRQSKEELVAYNKLIQKKLNERHNHE